MFVTLVPILAAGMTKCVTHTPLRLTTVCQFCHSHAMLTDFVPGGHLPCYCLTPPCARVHHVPGDVSPSQSALHLVPVHDCPPFARSQPLSKSVHSCPSVSRFPLPHEIFDPPVHLLNSNPSSRAPLWDCRCSVKNEILTFVSFQQTMLVLPFSKHSWQMITRACMLTLSHLAHPQVLHCPIKPIPQALHCPIKPIPQVLLCHVRVYVRTGQDRKGQARSKEKERKDILQAGEIPGRVSVPFPPLLSRATRTGL